MADPTDSPGPGGLDEQGDPVLVDGESEPTPGTGDGGEPIWAGSGGEEPGPMDEDTDDVDADVERTSATSVSVDVESASLGGRAVVTLSAEQVDRLEVRNLWTDWGVVRATPDGATFTDETSSAGRCVFEYDGVQDAVGPSVTVSFPDRYTGGDYGIECVATDTTSDTTETAPVPFPITDSTYLAHDQLYDMDDATVNRATSQHFQIVWGDEGHNKVDSSFVQANLEYLEGFWDRYVDAVGFRESSVSRQADERDGNRYKTNIYLTETGLDDHENGYAYMSSRNGYGHVVLTPDAMREDQGSGVLLHEFGHVLTMHTGVGWTETTTMGPWWEGLAEWFVQTLVTERDSIAVWARPFWRTGNFFQCHGGTRYQSWPIFWYLRSNPDDFENYGRGSVSRLLAESEPYENLWQMIDRVSPEVDAQDCLGHFAKRIPTQDYDSQDLLLDSWNDQVSSRVEQYWVYTELKPSPDRDGWWRVPIEHAPQQSGFNIVELDASSDTVTVEFDGLVDADLGSAWRAALVAAQDDGTTSYSALFGDGESTSVDVSSADSVYLTVVATPDTWYDVRQTSESDQPFQSYPGKERLPYEVRVSGATPKRTTSDPPGISGSRHPNGGGFVADSATVADSAFVGPNAVVTGSATVEGDAQIRDYAVVDGGTVSGRARVLERARVSGTVSDDAVAKGKSDVRSGATISGEGVVDGDFDGDNDVSQGTIFGFDPADSYVSNRPSDPGLILAYDFDEAHDVYALDRYGVDHGILRGEPSVSDGALDVSEPGQYVLLEDWTLDYDDLRIETTVTWDGGASGQRIWAFGASQSRRMYLTADDGDGTVAFRIEAGDTATTVTTDATLPVGTATTVTVTIESGTATVSVDGSTVGSASVSLTPADLRVDDPYETPHQNAIGRGVDDAAPQFAGAVRSFAMYRASLDGQ